MRNRTTTAIAAGFVGVVAMAAAAFAQTPSPSQEPPAGSDRTPRAERKIERLRKMVHSETLFQQEDGSFATAIADHGKVTKVEGSTVTIERLDGQSVTVTATDATKVRRNGEEAQVSAIKVGDNAHIVQLDDEGARSVTRIHAFDDSFKPRMHKRMLKPRGPKGDVPGMEPATEPAGGTPEPGFERAPEPGPVTVEEETFA